MYELKLVLLLVVAVAVADVVEFIKLAPVKAERQLKIQTLATKI